MGGSRRPCKSERPDGWLGGARNMAVQGSLNARVPCKVPCIQGGKDKGKKQKGQEAIDLVSGAFFLKLFF